MRKAQRLKDLFFFLFKTTEHTGSLHSHLLFFFFLSFLLRLKKKRLRRFFDGGHGLFKKNKTFFFWLAFAWGLIFLFVSDERAECTTAEVIFFLLEGENFPFFDADGQSGMSTDNTTQTEEKILISFFTFFSVFRYYAAL